LAPDVIAFLQVVPNAAADLAHGAKKKDRLAAVLPAHILSCVTLR
jgi:hypothetical protein